MPSPVHAPPAAASWWLGTWSRPPDRPAQVALVVALGLLVIALAPGGPAWLASTLDFTSLGDLRRRRRFLGVAAFCAAFLSLGYIAFYLRGGPRATDAAAYWLQGRALSHGELAWAVPDPSASFRTRLLLFSSDGRLAGIFPPGYPLLLAFCFLVGAPMLVGPAIAAALVLATWLLARELAESAGERDVRAEAVARAAVGLSIVSAALRYHTADALPYGAAAVAAAMALACALRARRTADARLFGVAGLALGALLATQPLATVAVAAVVAALAFGRPGAAAAPDAARPEGRASALAWACVGSIPGVLLLLAARHAATGHALASPAAAYLAAVAPPAPAHLGARAALIATLHRVRAHLLDVANLEPLALLALVPVLGRRRTPAAALAALVVAGEILVRAPFAAGAPAPGAGASLLVVALPIEHALVALALAQLFPRSVPRAATATLALALAGFAVHASYDHESAAAEDLGRPRFEPDVVREGSVANGLLFFDDDRGFELAFDPAVPASHGVEAVRMRGDDHDRLLYDVLGHPPAHRYLATAATASVVPWVPPGGSIETWRFEAESDWPPAARSGAWAEVADPGAPCASDGHVLSVTPSDGVSGSVTIALPVPRGPAEPTPQARSWTVTPRVLSRGGAGRGTLELRTEPDGPPLATWTWSDGGVRVATCNELPARPVELGGERSRAWLVVRAEGGSVALDKTTLRPAPIGHR